MPIDKKSINSSFSNSTSQTFFCRKLKHFLFLGGILFFLSSLNAQIGNPLIPDYAVDCGAFIIKTNAIVPPSSCNTCCVNTSCTQAIYQVKLALSIGALPNGAYNNGNFDLLYSELAILTNLFVDDGGITKINKKATEDCTILGSDANGSTFKVIVDEPSNHADLYINNSFLNEIGEALPVITFTNYETDVLLTVIVDFFPGESIGTGVSPTSFLYKDLSNQSCTSYSISASGVLPLNDLYPPAGNTSSTLTVGLGTNTCTSESSTFPITLSSSVSGTIEYLDFSVKVLTNTPLIGTPNITITGLTPSQPVIPIPLANDAGFNLHFIFENVSLTSGNQVIGSIVSEPELLSGGYQISANLIPGRFKLSGGTCEKPNIGTSYLLCEAAGIPACSDYSLNVQSSPLLIFVSS